MSILPNSGVTFSAVRGALGEAMSRKDLGNLCKSSRIKQWSFYKPVDSPKLNMSQPQDWYAVNDGFAINVYRDPFDLLDDFIGGIDNCWDYERPFGTSSSPYRLGDFRGYNSTAEMWFDFAFDNQDTAYLNETRRLVNNSTNPAVGLDEIINNFPAFSLLSSANSSQGSNWFVFLMIAADSNGNLPQSFYGCEIFSICNVLDYDDRLIFKVPSGITSGKYFFIPTVVRDYNTYTHNFEHLRRDDLPYYLSSKWWYPLPTNIFSLTINGGTNPHPLSFNVYINPNAYAEYTYNERYYTISGLQGKLKFVGSDLPTNRTQPIGISGKVIYNNAIVNGSTQNVEMNISGSIPTDSDECICSFTCSLSQFEVAVPQEDIDTQITLTVEYEVQYLGRTQNTVAQQDFIKVADIDGELDW